MCAIIMLFWSYAGFVYMNKAFNASEHKQDVSGDLFSINLVGYFDRISNAMPPEQIEAIKRFATQLSTWHKTLDRQFVGSIHHATVSPDAASEPKCSLNLVSLIIDCSDLCLQLKLAEEKDVEDTGHPDDPHHHFFNLPERDEFNEMDSGAYSLFGLLVPHS
jgi:hypothetical protein